MTKWKIEIKSVNGSYTTIDITNSISDPNKMVSELGKGQWGWPLIQGKMRERYSLMQRSFPLRLQKWRNKTRERTERFESVFQPEY